MAEAPTPPRNIRVPLLALVLLVCAQATWLVGEFGAERSASLQRQAMAPGNELTTLLRHETESAQRHLAIVQSQAEVVLKERVRQRVDEAVAIAQAIHDQAAGTMPQAAIKALVREALRSPRFFSGRGYYFIDDMDGNCILLPTVPRLEGTSLMNNRDDAGRYIMRELIRAVSGPGDAGYVRYSWYPPNVTDRMDDKVAYARQFKPFGWLIGTGDYVSAVEDGLKADALERLRAVRLSRAGHLVVLDQNGVIKLFPDAPNLEGTRLENLTDGAEATALRAIRAIAVSGGGGTSFTMAVSDTGRQQTWFAWAQSEPTFNWVVGAMAAAGEETEVAESGLWRSLGRFVLPLVMLVVVAVWIMIILSDRQREKQT